MAIDDDEDRIWTQMTMVMLQDKQGVQYMVTGDGSDIVQHHNGMAAVTATVTQQYVQVIWDFGTSVIQLLGSRVTLTFPEIYVLCKRR